MKTVQIAAKSTLVAVLLAAATLASAKTVKHSTMKASGRFIGTAAARRAALRAVPGRALTAGLENEDGKMQYAVMIRGKSGMHEVMVDAHTGKVASQEKVTAAEEAREAAAESTSAKKEMKSAKAIARHSPKKK